MSNQIEVAQVVAMIGSAYPNFTASEETVTIYYELLKDLPLDLLRAATMKCCVESGRKFAPSVGEIRGAASELNKQVQGIPSTLEAWNETCKANTPSGYQTMRNGEWVTPEPYEWSHPLVERTARLLGWPGHFPNFDNESTDRAHFFKMYDAQVNRFMEKGIEIPDVTGYIEKNKTTTDVKQLSERMSK